MNNRVLIVTGTTDILRSDIETDARMQEVFDMTLQSKIRYSKSHQYDLITLRSLGSDPTGTFGEKDLGFLRVIRCFQYLNFYECIMWIDADALITNYNYRIEDFELENEVCLYTSWDWNGRNSLNSGNFIIKKNNHINDFINAFMAIGKQVMERNIWGGEQTTFNHMKSLPEFKNNIKILEHKYLNSAPSREMYSKAWEGRNDIPYPWSKDSFLVHLTGVSNNDRLRILKENFKEYI